MSREEIYLGVVLVIFLFISVVLAFYNPEPVTVTHNPDESFLTIRPTVDIPDFDLTGECE